MKSTHLSHTLYGDSPKACGEETKFVLLSDLHNKVYGKHNKRLLYAITKQRPDAILIAGDMLVGKRGISKASDGICEITCKYLSGILCEWQP